MLLLMFKFENETFSIPFGSLLQNYFRIFLSCFIYWLKYLSNHINSKNEEKDDIISWVKIFELGQTLNSFDYL